MKKNNILIVEDDPNLGKILQDYLKLKGYKITLAVDGEDGLSKFSKDNFDFIILDIMMPKKDGFSLAKDIREINKRIPEIKTKIPKISANLFARKSNIEFVIFFIFILIESNISLCII